MKWYVYIVECSDKSFYTGITTDIKRRIWQHNNKVGVKSVYGRLPVKLVYLKSMVDQFEAAKREREIKGWGHKKKYSLILSYTLSKKGVYPEE